jgi:RHS repeat-associated protein
MRFRSRVLQMLRQWYRGAHSFSAKESVWRPRPRRGARLRLEALEDRVLPALVTWTNPLGGDWSVASNWSSGQLPGASDDVAINTAGITVTHSTGTDAINSLTSQANLVLSGGSLALAAASSVSGSLTESGGTLTGAGNLTVSGLLTWTGGTMSGTGTTTVAPGATLDVGGERFVSPILDGRTFNNAGTATASEGSAVSITNGGAFNNQKGATFTFTGTSTSGRGSIFADNASAFNNAGTITSSMTGNGGSVLLGRIDNTGTVQVQSDNVTVTSGGGSGNFSVAAGAVLEFTISSLGAPGNILTASSSVSGAGTVQFDFDTNLAGSYSITGSTVISGSQDDNMSVIFTGNVSSVGALAIGRPFGNGGAVTAEFDGGALLTVPTLLLQGGDPGDPFHTVLKGSEAITVTRQMTWTEDSTISGPGTFTLAAGASLTIGTNSFGAPVSEEIPNLDSGATFNNAGKVSLLNSNFSNGGVFNNEPGATFTIDSDKSSGMGGQFNNAGTFAVIGTDQANPQGLRIFGNLHNTGTLDVGNTLVIFPEGVTNDDPGFVTGGQLSGTLEVHGALVGATRNVDQFVPPANILLGEPGGFGGVQNLEVMSQDLGAVAAGFSHNFAFKTLRLQGNSYVQLVDNARNSSGTGTAPEALYVNTLVVPVNTTLDLQNLHVYARFAQIGGTIMNGSVTVLPAAGELLLGTPTPGSIAAANQVDDWTLSGKAGQLIRVIVNTGAGAANPPLLPYVNYAQVSLLDSTGNVLATSSNSAAGLDVTLVDVVLPSDGIYHIKVSVPASQSASQGNYAISAVDASTLGAKIHFNQPVNGSLPTPYGLDDWTFYGRAAQAITAIVNTTAAAPSVNYAQLSLVDPTGKVVASSSNTQTGADVTLSEVPLPIDGTYHLQVSVPPAQLGSQGNYALSVYDSTTHTTQVNLNQAVYGQLPTPYAVDLWTFSAPAGQQIRLNLLAAAAPGIQFDLSGPGGFSGFTGLTASSGLVSLPTSGEYTLKAHSTQGLAQAYAFRLDVTSQTDLVLGTVYQGILAGSGEAQLFKVDAPGAKNLSIGLQDSAAADHNEVYLKFGAPPTRSDFQYRFTTPASPNQTVVVPDAAPGTWYILVYSESVPVPGKFTLVATTSSIFLTGSTPDNLHLGNSQDATIFLNGAGFDDTTTINLIAADGTKFAANQVQVDSPTQLSATFAAGTVPAALYSIEAAQPSGDATRLPNAFTMVPGGASHLEVHLSVPDPLGLHISSTLYIEYANTGDIAMPAPLLVLTATQNGIPGAFLTLDRSLVTQGFYIWSKSATDVPDGYAESVQFVASGATPGILQPGERISVPVYYGGWLLASYDFNRPPFLFQVGVLDATNAVPLNLAATKDSLRPASIDPAAWDPIFANLQAQVGTTYGSYLNKLDADAAYLAHLGETVTDISKLWSYEIQQANGFTPIATLASARDAAVPAPGLSLSFDRVFTNSIVGHNQEGPLGRGWAWAGGWQRTLSVLADGTVSIMDLGGSERRFQPDSRNSNYFDQAGDHGTLTKLAGGAFTVTELNGTVTGFRPDGKVDYVQDTNGNRITAGYNASGELISLTHSSGQALTIAYNSAGRIISVTDPAGRVTTYTYDASNEHLLSVTTFDSQTTTYTYSIGAGAATEHALLSVTNPDGTHEFFTYDSQGRLADTHADGGAQDVTFAYGPIGTVTATDATGAATQYFFDQRGLLVKVKDPLGHAVRFSFDNSFNLVQVTDPAGQTYTNAYDANGNLTSSTDPLGHATQYTYGGSFNRLTSATDPNGNPIDYGYDSQGNLLTTTYANGTVERLAYDALGDPTTLTNRRGNAITFVYDASGRATSKRFADGTTTTYVYDARGNLKSATDPDGTTTLTYDTNDRLVKILYPSTKFLTYSYDAAGRRMQMVDQDGFTVNYTYDAVGRLAGLTDGGGKNIVAYTYDAAGRLSRKDMGNGTFTTYQYDAAGELLHLINLAPDKTVNSRFDYTYDALGNAATTTTLDGVWTYSYDAIAQLTHAIFVSNNTAKVPDQDLQYAYDAAGNRTQTIINGTTIAYSTNNLNQYTSVGSTTYGYDADGNQISKTDGSGTTTYKYDDPNRLIGVTTPTDTFSYQYDAFGNRMATTQNGQRTDYLIDPSGLGNLVGAYSAGGLVAHYTYGLGLTSRVDAAAATSFYDFDALGSTVGMTDSVGAYTNKYSYLPFGATQTATGTIPNPFTFVGKWGVSTDGNGLNSMGARFQDSVLGRFASPDPTGIHGGLNLYAYAANNPVTRVDPLGFGYFEANANLNNPVNWFDYSNHLGLQYGHEQYHFDDGTKVGFGPNEGANPFGTGDTSLYSNDEEGFHRLPGNYDDNKIRAIIAANPAGYYGVFSANCQQYCLEIQRVYDEQRGQSSGGDSGSSGEGSWSSFSTDPVADPDAGGAATPGPAGSAANPGSHDPNIKTGPGGFGTAGFVAPNTSFPYRVEFENDPTATAPAQSVTITDQLDPSLDANTFALTEVGFGDNFISIPAGTQHFQTTVPMTFNGKTFDVQIELGLHSDTRQVFATFQTIVPQTQLPPDVLTGFLPPEDGTGRGIGHISYVISPTANLPTGTRIPNVAAITFDANPVIDTDQVSETDPSKGVDPAKQALNTIDAGAPTSSVSALPAPSPTNFTVSWSGQDDTGGSGIATYDIFVADNGGAFQPFLTGTTQTSATFTGQAGHTYAFYSVATDNVGNREAALAAAQATTTVSSQTSTLTALTSDHASGAVYGQSVTITANVSATDTTFGTPTGSVQFLVDGNPFGTPVTLAAGSAALQLSALTASTHLISAAYTSDANSFVNSNTAMPLAQIVSPAPLTITANNQTAAYGAALPNLTAGFAGFVNGDTAASLTTAPTISTTATVASGVGSYPITASGAVDPNYAISYVAGALAITPAPLTITADNQTKLYGAALPTLSVHFTGLVNGDTAASLTTAPSVTTTAKVSSGVGSYPITATGAADANYAITYVAGTLKVTPAPLAITADDQTMVYGGPLPTLSVHYSGFVNGDTAANLSAAPTVSTTATSASGVGSYTIAPASATDPNYTIAYAPGTLSVTPAPLTVIADNKTMIAGGARPLFTVHYSGFVNGDTASNLSTPPTVFSAATAHSGPGRYSIAPSGAVDANYTITFVSGTLTVTAKPLTLTAPAKLKVHRGTASFKGQKITVSDPNAHAVLAVQVSTTLGKLHLLPIAGVKITANKKLTILKLTGTQAALNRALNAVTLSLSGPHAKAKVTLTASDGHHIARATINVGP